MGLYRHLEDAETLDSLLRTILLLDELPSLSVVTIFTNITSWPLYTQAPHIWLWTLMILSLINACSCTRANAAGYSQRERWACLQMTRPCRRA